LVEKFLWVFEFLMLILLHHKPLISFFSLNGISFFATILYSCFTLLLMYNVWFKLRRYNSLKMEQHKNINVCNVTSMFVCFLVGWLICLSYSFYLFCLVKWRIGYLFVILLVVLTSPRADLSLCLVSQWICQNHWLFTKCSFLKITVDHCDFDMSTVIPNIHLGVRDIAICRRWCFPPIQLKGVKFWLLGYLTKRNKNLWFYFFYISI
jgi:hypothetical protein